MVRCGGPRGGSGTRPLKIMDFNPSDPRSIGVELEYQLLDEESLDLVDRIMPVMEFFPDEKHVKPEFIQNTVEVTSSVHHDLDSLENELMQQTARLSETCHSLGIRLAGAGTHPFSERLSLLTPLPRYQRLEEAAGLLAHTQITFSTHVHLGMASRDEMIALMRALKPYLPLLIGLSANSPFWFGYDTGFADYRQRILAASRNYGIPPSFRSWEEFTGFFSTIQRIGMASSMRDLHWDIRPRPDFGTLEIRVMDAQPTVRQAMILAGFTRALTFFLRRHLDEPDYPGVLQPMHWWLEKHNHFEAARLGMEARIILDEQGTTRTLIEVFDALMEKLVSIFDELGQGEYQKGLLHLVAEGPGYSRQCLAIEAGGTLKHVTADLADALERELAVAGFSGKSEQEKPETA